MEKKHERHTQVKIERFHLSVRLGAIFFPVEFGELVPILQDAGYLVRKDLTERIPDLPLGAKVVFGGAIAEKGDVGRTFRLEPDRGVIAIAGHDIEGILADFSSIEQSVEDRLNVKLEEKALFYEFIAEGTAATGKDPTKVIASLLEGHRLQSELSDILGFPVTNFGLRIVEQNRNVTDATWFDFRIEPLVPKPNTTYHINVIYRHPNRENVVKAAQSLSETAGRLISAMEHEA